MKTPMGPCIGSKCAAWLTTSCSRECRGSIKPPSLPKFPRPSSSDLIGFVDRPQGCEHLAHMSVEVLTHDVENFKNATIANRVEDLIAGFAVHENILRTQNRQVLRGVRLLNTEPLNNSAGRKLPFS